MSTSSIPEVVPVMPQPVLEVLPAQPPPRPRRGLPGPLRALLVLLDWAWRIVVGAFFCMNIFTSVLVTGWTNRWIQARVLRGWWKL